MTIHISPLLRDTIDAVNGHLVRDEAATEVGVGRLEDLVAGISGGSGSGISAVHQVEIQADKAIDVSAFTEAVIVVQAEVGPANEHIIQTIITGRSTPQVIYLSGGSSAFVVLQPGGNLRINTDGFSLDGEYEYGVFLWCPDDGLWGLVSQPAGYIEETDGGGDPTAEINAEHGEVGLKAQDEADNLSDPPRVIQIGNQNETVAVAVAQSFDPAVSGAALPQGSLIAMQDGTWYICVTQQPSANKGWAAINRLADRCIPRPVNDMDIVSTQDTLRPFEEAAVGLYRIFEPIDLYNLFYQIGAAGSGGGETLSVRVAIWKQDASITKIFDQVDADVDLADGVRRINDSDSPLGVLSPGLYWIGIGASASDLADMPNIASFEIEYNQTVFEGTLAGFTSGRMAWPLGVAPDTFDPAIDVANAADCGMFMLRTYFA